MAHDVFISYASEDKPIADAVCAKLEGRGIRCWIAPRDVLPGEDWGEAIVTAIDDSRLMVLVFSASSNGSEHVKNEVERTVSKGKPVLPFRVEEVEPSGSLALHLSRRHWLDALTPPLEKHLVKLAETTRLLLSRLDGREAPAEQLVTGAAPAARGVSGPAEVTVQRPTAEPVAQPASAKRLEQGKHLRGAAAGGHIDHARRLLEAGADVNAAGKAGRTPLHRAASMRRLELARLLLEQGAEVNAVTWGGRTPLHWAAENGHLELAVLLLEAGADVNAADNMGLTPLSVAKQHGHTAVADLFRRHGAKE